LLRVVSLSHKAVILLIKHLFILQITNYKSYLSLLLDCRTGSSFTRLLNTWPKTCTERVWLKNIWACRR
jgi:hypothetical protein